jgi:Zn finger protein HypA/HybF involved in hydrogenase expression
MKKKESVFKCPVCGKEITGEAGSYKRCKNCGKDMAEVNRGIITK